ncbi:transcriptional regulator domain protein [Methylobacterium sp. 4-46]|uniref:winged helix-turn-helix domain-containing protein n=1 Tax=unclassified Methylobacterium TaxID=2615210 RepID=UPI000152CF15|nr:MULTISPECIES: winged helix-turn-helix domain-containing protein [Methylobacterium]ACA17226.1 transcriptional regulator domain protein [Methylobacterium sp. 4-46]WFT82908.1 winged helix-turn-helix domain-containing protein [Methylobacterium nodulans]
MALWLDFGPFRLDTEMKLLLRDGAPVALGPRAVAVLQALVARAGAPVSKEELFRVAWPDLAVEDSNLTVQIAALRRALAGSEDGARWIETLPRRGYRYVGPVGAAPSMPPVMPRFPDRPSVAVLPLRNLSGDPAEDYFGDGMAEDITAGLSRIKWLFVTARSSGAVYRGREIDPCEAGRALGARYLLLGSLRKETARIRVALRLVESEAGGVVWAEAYDRPLEGVFALQDDIAMSVVGAIEPNLRQAEAERVRRLRPESLDAYDLVLRAQSDVFTGMPAESSRALGLLGRALELEPRYGLAHAFAAMCHHNLFLRAGLSEVDRAASIRHAEKAIAHGRDDALALTFAGFSLAMDAHDRRAGSAAFEAALAVSPSSATTYILGGVVHGWAGDAERAITWGERALRLSPFDPWAFAAYHALALGHLVAGRAEAAAAAAYKGVHANPVHSISHMILAATLARLGSLDTARAAAARVMALQPVFRFSRQLAGVDCAPDLAAALGEALRACGLPE